ncbi:MAG: hypothetical protein ACK5RL_07530 [Acidimicrobiales bacterium]
MTAGGTSTTGRRALEEERDTLLDLLDQLDRELADGDLTRDDYDRLHGDATRRAAAILRRLDGEATTPAGDPAPPGRARRWTFITVGMVAAAAVAGVILARAAGERGVGDQLTGSVAGSTRDRVMECQQMGAGGGDLLGALECYDGILEGDPENTEALTYRGWYVWLAAASVRDQAAGDAEMTAQADELGQVSLDYLNRAVASDPAFPDALAFRSVVHDRLGQGPEACADVAALLELDPPEFFVTQTSGVAERNSC